MNIKKLFLSFILFYALSNTGKCQTEYNLPPYFDQFFKNFYLLNPAILDTTERIGLSLGNRTLTGLFEGVTRFYGDVSALVHPKNANISHSVGLQAITSKDGPIFSRNRAYFRYAYRTALYGKVSISAGLSLGVVNYTTKGSQANAGGSASVPDGNLGIWLTSPSIQVGFSCQQMLEPNVQPIIQSFRLYRYFNYNLNHLLKLSSSLSLRTSVFVKHQPHLPLNVEAAPLFVWKNIFETGINYKYNKGVALAMGFSNINIYMGHVRVMASYFLNTHNLSGVNDNVLEFSVGYAYKK